jgi:phospholipase C
MTFAARTLLIVSLAATFTYTQNNNLPHVQHVIVVIQENRTPDNLFQQDLSVRLTYVIDRGRR